MFIKWLVEKIANRAWVKYRDSDWLDLTMLGVVAFGIDFFGSAMMQPSKFNSETEDVTWYFFLSGMTTLLGLGKIAKCLRHELSKQRDEYMLIEKPKRKNKGNEGIELITERSEYFEE